MPELYVSWSDYHHTIEQLAVRIYNSGWQFEHIACLAKGGLRVGDILSRLFDRPLAILSVSSYGGADNRERGKVRVSEHLSMTEPSLGPNLLLVDDLVDSGESLQAAIAWLHAGYGDAIEDMRTAVLWCKDCSKFAPDFHAHYLPDNPWIHQPFEPYEQMTPAELSTRYSSAAAM
ncbi:putative phosphoribosyltransferase [Rubidibacter lacunae KORDI 51-2]|uniref:Putative phosphoribosyltransferase n=1 Tax=Rubidibacter lacunae KORDI 51-2 TaxID=582515 RepID=U5DBY6_9CHRO|nr:phosphoribosyltransferase family protein [Rubidibacter lacunae]ERN42043.1 putative phosphoribosyltransferase [Rubidibacter lacunae KORDI 51-2]